MFQCIPNVLDGVEVRALCRPGKFFHTKLEKRFLYGAGFEQGGFVYNRVGKTQTGDTKLEEYYCLKKHFMLQC